MRFLVDECTGPAVAKWLRSLHHDVFSVYDEARRLKKKCESFTFFMNKAYFVCDCLYRSVANSIGEPHASNNDDFVPRKGPFEIVH